MWYAYDIASNGLVTNGRVFYDVSSEKELEDVMVLK